FRGKADMTRSKAVPSVVTTVKHALTLSAINGEYSSSPPEVFLQILASLFVRDLEHFFARGYIVAIVYSPNERYVLVHVIAPILRVYA
ncbi:MAG: hypothetical protein WCF86_07395, partial [Pseudolabrys sp.]